jgi:hypothetical protein
VSSEGTSTPDGDAERFAASLDGSADVAPDGDPELEREVELARRLGALGGALDPDPQTRERARQRLLAALAREARPDDDPADGPPRAS